MPRVSAAFFGLGVLYLACGMAWGMYMGSHEDFVLAPAHAHLNLLGWVTMALYGIFYALTAATLSARLAWINFIVSGLGVAFMIPALALMLTHNNDPKYIPFIGIGEILTVLGLLVFAASVVREIRRPR